MSFAKVLIANRGEIAVRVIRTCQELGMSTAAVYSEADEGSMHRRLADESYPIGPSPAAESYLDAERLIEAADRSGAEAVHPGYGFLSESSAFARSVEDAGMTWVGPPPRAMDAVGFKVRAKGLARQAGVPVLPGYDGDDDSEERLTREAANIGYPVLVKASAGGGGRGMRAVTAEDELAEAVRGAKREAAAAFGDGSVFLEKLLEEPRHVEVQVIADAHDSVLHLYERECSIQRRHQKVVEESPSPALGSDLRREICAAAVRLTREAGYRNAGTVEFLLDGEDYFFLEMNARLQVEHPVTELVTGLDLVHLQLAVAAGEPLPVSQDDVLARGAAIEVRIYAEEDGVPAGGRLLSFVTPEGPGVRNDVGVEVGDEVSLFYDPMISKLIVHAQDRTAAVRRLGRALDDYSVLGLPTNLALLRRIAAHPAFVTGETTTRFFDEHQLAEPEPEPPVPREAVLLAAATELCKVPASPEPFAAGPWRLLGASRLRFQAGDGTHEVEAGRSGGHLTLSYEGRESDLEVLAVRDGRLNAVLDGAPITARVAGKGTEVSVSLGGVAHRLSLPPPPEVDAPGPGGADTSGASLTAPMPGTVVKVLVAVGDEVDEGQPLLVLEAMKTEQPFPAPRAGRVCSLPFGEGDLVPGGSVLAEIEET